MRLEKIAGKMPNLPDTWLANTRRLLSNAGWQKRSTRQIRPWLAILAHLPGWQTLLSMNFPGWQKNPIILWLGVKSGLIFPRKVNY